MELVDYAFSVPSVASLVAAGKHGAGRYIGPGSASKHLTAPERDRLLAAGLCIWLSVEGGANDALQGASLGASHGAMAVRDATWLSAPKGVALFANVDLDVTPTQWPACRNYLNAFGKIVRAGGYRVGLYGGYNAIAWGSRDKVADIFWQTYAWSGGRWHPAAQLQQYHNGVTLGGADVDLCRNVADDFGQWTKEGTAMGAGQDVWNTVITSPSMNYTQPASEWLKWTYSTQRVVEAIAEAVAAIDAKLDSGPAVQVDAAAVAAALAADKAFLAALAKAVNDDAAARLAD